MPNEIKIKRATQPAAPEDGFRMLVDRLWPKGIAKDGLDVRMWAKSIAPSDELRRWYRYNRDPNSYEEFRERYFKELDGLKSARVVAEMCFNYLLFVNVTLVHDSPDPEKNNAAVLREWLIRGMETMG